MFSSFQVSHSETPHHITPSPPSMRVLPNPHTHSSLLLLALLYTGVSNTLRSKGLSFH